MLRIGTHAQHRVIIGDAARADHTPLIQELLHFLRGEPPDEDLHTFVIARLDSTGKIS